MNYLNFKNVVTCNLMGGLGNQLFIIFATISYAMKYKKPFVFLDKKILGEGTVTKRPTYFTTFLSKIQPFTANTLSFFNYHIVPINEASYSYNELNIPLQYKEYNANKCVLYLCGYFQSYKYFKEHYDTICKLIDLENIKNNVLRSHVYDYDNMVSLHFRISDYKKNPDCHPIMTDEYYKKAIDYIINKTGNSSLAILYFNEKEDNDIVIERISALQKEYPLCSFIHAEYSISDWEQMLLMSLCKHNIIANSSFSLWGAYFNSHDDKIVCYPETWFGEKLKHYNTNDLIPEEQGDWYKVS
jgi:hypothetical protein